MRALGPLILLSLAACQQSVVVRPAAVTEPPPAIQASGDAPRYHEVQAGDTLYKISVQYGVDYRDLATWNGIEAPYTIYPRQRLQVASNEGQPAVTAEAPSPPVAEQPTSAVAPIASAPMPVGGERVGGAVVGPRDPGFDQRYGVTVPEGAVPLDGIAAPPAPTPAETPITSAPEPVVAPAVAPITAPATAATDTTPATGANTAAGATPSAAPKPVSIEQPSSAGWIWPAQGRVVVTYAAGDPTRQGIDIAGEPGASIVASRDGEVVYSGAGLIGYGELIIIKHSPELLSAYGHNRVRLVKEGDKVKAGQKIAEMGKNAANRVLVHFEIRRNGKPVDPMPLLPRR